eukprot:CAMPEP_0178387810 /NCGR_PEP_ID=MMETSP0689_2-20121128/9267_1 /TAXON_ID=160604 /ORGANISM="Amphidinium massartii, Strain CS-259" /LENGTH=464 /DNA_ID=CAMNT_0020008189 /DNA_START=103 /DNA_END=1497 /DNA_ORIENTATION=-
MEIRRKVTLNQSHRKEAMNPQTPQLRESFEAQLDRRRRAQYAEFAAAVADVDITLFTREALDVGGQLDPSFEVRGALPPTTVARRDDPVSAREISRSDKEAARSLIAKQREADYATACQKVQSAREERRASSLVPHILERGGEAKPSQSECASLELDEAKRKAKEEAQNHVARCRFELMHKKREAALVSARRRLDLQAVHQEYKADCATQLVERSSQDRDEKIIAKDRRQQQVELASARKRAREAVGLFALRVCAADSMCRRLDVQEERMRKLHTTADKVADRRQVEELRKAQMAGRRILAQAQQHQQRNEDRDRIRFLSKVEDQRQAAAHAARRTKIRAERELAKVLHDAREAITAREDATTTTANDVADYEETLKAFQDLALGVSTQCTSLRKRMQGLSKETATMMAQSRDISNPDDGAEDLYAEDDADDVASFDVLEAVEPKVRATLGLPVAQPEDDSADD